MLDFVAMDFETANRFRESACALGLVVVRDERIREERSWLIRPHEELNWFEVWNMEIHGITQDQVAESPEFPRVWAEALGAIGDLPILAHNAPFDMMVIRRSLALYGLEPPMIRGACSVKIAKKAWRKLSSYALDNVAHHLGISFEHHEALSDARTCADVALLASSCLGIKRFVSLAAQADAWAGTLCDGFEDCCTEVNERRGKYSYVASREGGEFSHDSPPQRERQERALQTILLELDREGKKARFLSSTDEVTTYETSLDWCTCTDYARRHLPCKHMYRLANEVGIF